MSLCDDLRMQEISCGSKNSWEISHRSNNMMCRFINQSTRSKNLWSILSQVHSLQHQVQVSYTKFKFRIQSSSSYTKFKNWFKIVMPSKKSGRQVCTCIAWQLIFVLFLNTMHSALCFFFILCRRGGKTIPIRID